MRIIRAEEGIIEKTTTTTKITLRDPVTAENYETELLLAYHGWPTAVKDENGVLYVAASGNRLAHVDPFGETCLYVSRDGGKTWEKSVINKSVETGRFTDYRDTGLLYLGSGRMVMTFFTHNSNIYTNGKENLWVGWQKLVANADPRNAEAIIDVWKEKPWFSGNYVIFSNDYGKTWSEAQPVPLTAPHGPTLLSDGRLLFAGRKDLDIFIMYGNVKKDHAGSITGIEWSEPEFIFSSADYSSPEEKVVLCEPHAIELKSGRYVLAIRVQNQIDGKPRDSEKCFTGLCTYVCISDDRGKTWKRTDGLRLAGSPPHLLEIADNAVVLSVAQRLNPAPCHPAAAGEFVYVSTDGGETWSEELTLSPGPNGDCGYPSTVLLSKEGKRFRFFTAYYQNDGETTNLLKTEWELLI